MGYPVGARPQSLRALPSLQRKPTRPQRWPLTGRPSPPSPRLPTCSKDSSRPCAPWRRLQQRGTKGPRAVPRPQMWRAAARGLQGPAGSRRGQRAAGGRPHAWPRRMPGCSWLWAAVRTSWSACRLPSGPSGLKRRCCRGRSRSCRISCRDLNPSHLLPTARQAVQAVGPAVLGQMGILGGLRTPFPWLTPYSSASGAIPAPRLLGLSPLSPLRHTSWKPRWSSSRGRNIEKLKCFNRLLSAVLQGYKGQCEGLSMQLGQREAEATALHLALQYSEDCEKVYGALLTLREADSGAGEEVPLGNLWEAEKEALRLLAQEKAAMDGEAQRDTQLSPEGSSVDRPMPQEVAAQLQAYLRRLQQRRALVKIPPEPGPTLAPSPNMPRAEAMLQAMLGGQPCSALPRLEKMQIQQELAGARETLADLTLQLQMARREKRGLELQEAALRAQGPAHALLLEQLRWEQAQLRAGEASGSGAESSGGGSSGDDEEGWVPGPLAVPGGTSGMDGGQVGKGRAPEELARELVASLTRATGLREQLGTLREELEQVAQKERARRA
ncbi:harmonin-binding protein USHBP1 isoform X3 [Tamandua tetradactyla]|uniref:harmonin-binding protein USHBP1 isoform X3 n=1 Tax=Tamandua tetradactyla TaxID=48850 RepID=UPI004053F3F0